MALLRSQHLTQRQTRIEILNLDLIRLYRMPSVAGDVQSVSADPRREPRPERTRTLRALDLAYADVVVHQFLREEGAP